jgi:hypothetical protein
MLSTFNYLDHWPSPWPKRHFKPTTNPKILDRIIGLEQALLQNRIELLKKSSTHTALLPEISSCTDFELALHHLVTYRVMYLQHQGWPPAHNDKLRAIFAHCAPKINALDLEPTPPPP